MDRADGDGHGERRLDPELGAFEARHWLRPDGADPSLREMVEQSPLALPAFDRDGVVHGWNAACEALFGWSPAEVLGGKVPFVPDDAREAWAALQDRMFAGEIIHGAEIEVVRKDGGRVHVSVGAAPVRAVDGKVVAVMALMADVSDRRRAQEALRASEEQFRVLASLAPIGIVRTAADFGIVSVNRKFLEIAGLTEEEALARRDLWARLLPPDDIARLRGELYASPARQEFTTVCRIRRPDDELRWVRMRSVAVGHETNDVAGYISTLEDITDRRLAAEALRESEERFRSAFEHAPIGMALTDVDGRIFRHNGALARMLGRDDDGLVGVTIREITHPDDWEHNREMIDRLFRGEIDSYAMEKRYLRAAGHVVWAALNESVVRDANGQPHYVIGQMQDITHRRELDEQLAHQATHDPLTGLPNRSVIVERLERVSRHPRRGGPVTAVLFLDLDNLKVLNDSLGHSLGDRLLVELGRRLRESLRPGDLVARFGGDEFVLVCENLDGSAAALELAERVLRLVQQPFEFEHSKVVVSASIGITTADGARPETLLRDADAAMYLAKEHGRARAEFFDESLRARVVARLDIERDLRRALDEGQFVLHFQPMIRLDTEALVGFEALLRWRHPTRGLLAPDSFLDVAEKTGLIRPLGACALNGACRQLARWEAEHPEWGSLVMGVNLSAGQLVDRELPSKVATILEGAGVDPSRVSFEITENDLVEDASTAAAALAALRELGVRLALDDFGTGYSSLVHLKQLPISAVKLDQSFIHGLTKKPDDEAIVVSMVGLGRTLGLSVVAEGIETESQLTRLREIGCEYGQGRFWADAMPPAEVERLLAGARAPVRLLGPAA